MGLLDDYAQLLTNERQKQKIKGLLGVADTVTGADQIRGIPADPRNWSIDDTAKMLNFAGGGIGSIKVSHGSPHTFDKVDLSYRGEHKAPMKDSGVPLHNLTANENAVYPDDVYSIRAADYYGTGEPEDRHVFNLAHHLKGKPDEKVTMYRAIPDPNFNATKQIKELQRVATYKNKYGFFPNDNQMVNGLYDKHFANVEGVSYDDAQQNMLDDIYGQIADLEASKVKLPSINNGDWVAIDRKYAKEHGESALNGEYKILSKKVPARKLFTNGDSIREWGYDESGLARLGILPFVGGVGLLGYGLLSDQTQQ